MGGGDMSLPESEVRANVRLIAAAPELLEALKRCADALLVAVRFGSEELPGFDPNDHEVIKQARAAIRKATGQEA